MTFRLEYAYLTFYTEPFMMTFPLHPIRDLLCSYTVEFQLSGRWLSASPIIRIGLARRVDLSRILQNYLALEVTCYRIKHGTELWLVELQMGRIREV